MALTAVTASGPPAFAQDKKLADKLFDEAQRLLKQKRLGEACEKFAASYAADAALGALLNLADCNTQLGKTATAFRQLDQAAQIAIKRGDKEREQFAIEQRDALKPKLSNVRFKVTPPIERFELQIDDQPASDTAADASIALDPGSHRLAIAAPGRQPASINVEIAKGPQEQTLEVSLPETESKAPAAPTPAPVSPAPKPEQPRSTVPKPLIYALGGVGVLGIGVGSYFGLRTFSKKSDSDAYCQGTRCTQPGLDLRDEAKTSATISTISFGVGVVALAGAGYLWFTSSKNRAPGDQALRVLPIADQHAGGAVLTSAW